MSNVLDQLDPALVVRVQAAERECDEARAALSDAILGLSPFQKNDIVRDKDTGARYRVDGGSGYLASGRPQLLLRGYRVYSTGRREARSVTWLRHHNMEKSE